MSGPLQGMGPADRATLERRAVALAEQPAPESARLLRFLVFRVGSETYGLPVDVVREIVSGAAPTPVPGAPASVRGVISLRGEIVSVIDPGVRLGLAGVAGPRPVLAVVRCDDVSTALAVDAIADIVEVPEDAIAAPLPLLDRVVADAVAGSFETPEGPVALLSAAPLLEPFGSER